MHCTGVDTQRTRLADADAVIAVLGEEFGIRVPHDPRLRDAIERLLRP